MKNFEFHPIEINEYFLLLPNHLLKTHTFAITQHTLLRGRIRIKSKRINTFDNSFIPLTSRDNNSLYASLSNFSILISSGFKMTISSTPIQTLTILKNSNSRRLKCQFWWLTGFVISLLLYIIKFNRKNWYAKLTIILKFIIFFL